MWPASDVSTANLDAGTDSPQLARADLKDLADNANAMRGHVTPFMQGVLDDADAATARATLVAAKSGANTDITSLGSVTGVTAAAGDSSTKLATTEFVAGAGVKRGYIAGCILSTPGSSTSLLISAGVATDDTHTTVLAIPSTGKTTAAWSAGGGVGGLDTGTIANNTGYHVWAIGKADGTRDVLISLSATTPTMPSGFTLKRRIGWAKTNGSAQWLKFRQIGDTFLLDAAVFDVGATNPGTSAVSRTLSVPGGVEVEAIVNAGVYNTGTGVSAQLLLSSLHQADAAPSETAAPLSNSGGLAANATGGVRSSYTQTRIWTNTSAQIRSRLLASDASVTLYIATVGWVDPRGKDA